MRRAEAPAEGATADRGSDRTVRPSPQQLDVDITVEQADVTIGEQGNLKVARPRAQPRDPEIDQLASQIANELDIIELPDLLLDIDETTRASSGNQPKPRRSRSSPPRSSHGTPST
jgi:hypothetical protein